MYSRFNITCASVYICLICIIGIYGVLDIHTKTSTAMRLIKNSRLKTISSITCCSNLKAYSSIAQYSLRSEFSTTMYEFSLGNIIQIDINRSFSIVFHLICNIRRIDSLIQQHVVNGRLGEATLCATQYQEQYPDKQFSKMLHVIYFQFIHRYLLHINPIQNKSSAHTYFRIYLPSQFRHCPAYLHQYQRPHLFDHRWYCTMNNSPTPAQPPYQ